MPDSPISATPYEVLRVSTTASTEELKAAYRRRLRETHPDTGGDAVSFSAVQAAWERIGTPDVRAAYDRGSRSRASAAPPGGFEQPDTSGHGWEPRSRAHQADTRPRARSYGHPGGWRRERYLTLLREWVGRGETIDDPYDPALVRSAPRALRHLLADALAEESTARTLTDLGIGFTVWHDVDTGSAEQKIDHVVLGPTGLYAVLSEDFGDVVRVRKGELLVPAGLGDRPMHDLGTRAKVVARAARVTFSALLIVVPDDELDESLLVLGAIRGATTAVVTASRVGAVLREGLPGARTVGGTELFDVRTRLQSAIRFVGVGGS
ncbi:J domain-containing protein [Lacisediminihabitans changchengi]|uniref:DnaJ domain-containing protein n=1 Tax=Lacisediminihabitans changchengi TaxID=2787634 RepID=A0A934W3I6_9MICO|nr:DnaJ domain-containing protein [Lacisediminihabitans changchengi]MBK4346936.1 DnaJ domain-containing protein [Lacisediminihabitans changchengi]MBK4347941.1 DnaJ domain-containing protein [Lacisediminihabitans changchengi]